MTSNDELIRRIVLGITEAIADMAERMAKEPTSKNLPGNIVLEILAQTIRDTSNKFAEALAEQHTKH